MVKDMNGNEWTLREMQVHVGSGWAKLIHELYEICNEHNVDVYQIKEKFGGLRFYVGSAPDVVFEKIEKAEDRSFKICEFCGEPGKPRSHHGWIKTSCKKCFDDMIG